MKPLGPTFGGELAAAGLDGLPFSWGSDGSFCGVERLSPEDYAKLQAVVAAHDPTKQPVPQTVTPRQARLALLAAGLLDQVQAAVDAAGGATKITWEYATVIDRNDPMITGIGQALGLTPAQIDNLFANAISL
jgi:hypothetical protein